MIFWCLLLLCAPPSTQVCYVSLLCFAIVHKPDFVSSSLLTFNPMVSEHGCVFHYTSWDTVPLAPYPLCSSGKHWELLFRSRCPYAVESVIDQGCSYCTTPYALTCISSPRQSEQCPLGWASKPRLSRFRRIWGKSTPTNLRSFS